MLNISYLLYINVDTINVNVSLNVDYSILMLNEIQILKI